ncbi:MAG: hypothetical protein R3C45_15810 [Phycisphaerales bacterium]
MKCVQALTACLILTAMMSDAPAQSLAERIAIVKDQRNRATEQQSPQPESLQIPQKMSVLIDEVLFDQTPARDVFNWWATRVDVPLVIDWDGMALEGINPEQGITLDLKTVPARILLDVLMRQASPDVELIYEVTPWYVQVMTKRQANRNPVLKVYDVSDIVMRVPNFTNAPSFDLNEALSNTSSGGSGSSGGGGGGGSGGIFTDASEDDGEDEDSTKAERGESIAELIRETIEPGIWQENGGAYASVRFYDGRLIVNAPMYVHRQIGMPTVSGDSPRSISGYKSSAGGTDEPSTSKPFGTQPR